MAPARAINKTRPKAATAAPHAPSQNTTGLLVDFHLFADLAPELQDAIWEFACYATPSIIPMFINERFFKFEFNNFPTVPAILHATSGARAIALGHFTLLKAENFNRYPRIPAQPQQPLQLLAQIAQAPLQNQPQAPLPHDQNQNSRVNSLIWQTFNANAPPAHGPLGQLPLSGPGVFAPVHPAPTQSLRQQSLTQNGQHHHDALQQGSFGGNFPQMSPLASAQQSFTSTIPQPRGTNQTTALPTLNPPAAISNTLASHNPSAIQQPRVSAHRALVAKPSRCFYVNLGSDFFRIQVGFPTSYHYPAFSLAQFPQLPNCVSGQGRLIYLQQLQHEYTLPSPFPATGRLPGIFANMHHLVLNLELPPCHSPFRSSGFISWMRRSVDEFCSIVVKSTIAEFPNIKNLDLLIAGDVDRRKNDQMVLKHWRCAPIREENGVTFGHRELGLLEMEFRIWLMSEFMGKNGPEGPEVRIVVHIPRHYSQTKC